MHKITKQFHYFDKTCTRVCSALLLVVYHVSLDAGHLFTHVSCSSSTSTWGYWLDCIVSNEETRVLSIELWWYSTKRYTCAHGLLNYSRPIGFFGPVIFQYTNHRHPFIRACGFSNWRDLKCRLMSHGLQCPDFSIALNILW